MFPAPSCLALLLALSLGLGAGEPPPKPILRLETGTHTAVISRIALGPGGQWLATASEDKTVRIWDTASGLLRSTLRPPSGDGSEGQLFACAASPDGRTLAVAGRTGWTWDHNDSIYLFDVASGQLTGRIPDLPSVVTYLSYAQDGRLAASLGSKGFRVFKTDGTEAFRDEDYGQGGGRADFDRAGRLVTCWWDGSLKLYDARGGLQAKVHVAGNPYSVRFSPDGGTVAVGYYVPVLVELRSGVDLSLQAAPGVYGIKGDIRVLGWSPDGRTLYGGGAFRTGNSLGLRSWSKGGRGAGQDSAIGGSTLTDLAVLPDGRVVWAGYEADWGFLGGMAHTGSIVNFRNLELGLDPGGTTVAFGYGGGRKAVFDAASGELRPDAGPALPGPRTSAPGLLVEGWRHQRDPRLNGQPLALGGPDMVRSLAMTPQGGFLLGANPFLYALDGQGQVLWKVLAPGENAWAVNVGRNGALAAAAFGDGTIRWYRMTDGKELLAFCPPPDGRRWVAWTPSGFYNASPGGEDLIGWQVNRGGAQTADFFPASRFRSQFYRPEVLARVLETLDEAAAPAGGRVQPAVLEAQVPPVVRILSPGFGARISQGQVTVRATVAAPPGQTVASVWAAVDGRRVEARGVAVKERPADGADYQFEVPVPAQDCTVSVFAQCGAAVSEAASVRLAWAGAGTPDFVIQPRLYVLAVGISSYQDPDFKLGFAAKDARDFSAALVRQKARLYRDVEVKLLTDAAATREAVMDGLEWLERQTTAKDVAVLFLAGHGINDEVGAYFYLPWNADPDRVKSTMIPSTEFQSTLAKLPGKALLFLDSCHSGNVLKVKLRGATDPNRFINELSSAENGVVVFSASTGRQASQESPEWGNGAFTKAVVEGLDGKADFQHSGRVTLNMLDLYVSERVKQLTRGSQSPTTAKPNNVQDFPIALAK